MIRMLKDVLQMLFLFFVILLSFAMAITRLFSYYNGMTRVEDGELEEQPEQFQR